MHRRKWAALGLTTLVSTTTAAAFTLVTGGAAQAAVGCSVKYTVSSQWSGGFGANVDVTNLGAPVTGWTVAFTFPAGQTVSQLWNGSVTQSGSSVTVRNAGWNGAVATGGTASFGFNGSWTGSNPVPTSFTLNGVACTGTVDPTPTDPTPTEPTPDPTGDPKTKIMALGDSITGSPGCWRAMLWQQLPAAEVDFVGTLPGDGCGFPYDGEHEGHGGYQVTNVAGQNMLPAWLAASDPDVVLMHFGTNDAWSNIPATTILNAYTTLVGQMRAANPRIKIIVAQIIPLNPPTCTDCGQRVVTLNAAIPSWAAALSTDASPITVVDQWTGFDTTTDTYDGVHPNNAGNAKIAARWLPAVRAALP